MRPKAVLAAALLSVLCYGPVVAGAAPPAEGPEGADGWTASETSIVLTPQTMMGQLTLPAFAPGDMAPNDERPRGADEIGLYAKVAPAVVLIQTPTGFGTGSLIGADGSILTNAHVVEGGTFRDSGRQASYALIHMGRLTDDGAMETVGTPLRAFVYKTDADRDLALLRLESIPPERQPLPHIPLSDGPVQPGMDCAIVGHPSAGMLWTFRTGLVSSAGDLAEDLDWASRFVHARAGQPNAPVNRPPGVPKRRVLLTALGTNPGDSGAPIVDAEGRLIGVHFGSPREPAHLEEFDYNVHLSEVRAFLAEQPKQALLLVPDPWVMGALIRLVDVDEDDRWDVLLGASPSITAMLLDLDHDTPAQYAGDSGMLVAQRKWDFEVALHMEGGRATVFYDTDNDGVIDLILSGSGETGLASERFERSDTGRWRYDDEVLATRLLAAAYLPRAQGESLNALLPGLAQLQQAVQEAWAAAGAA